MLVIISVRRLIRKVPGIRGGKQIGTSNLICKRDNPKNAISRSYGKCAESSGGLFTRFADTV